MRIKVSFYGSEGKDSLSLPVHHNEILQGIIYKYIDNSLAERFHASGLKDPKSNKKIKPFVFSRLLSRKFKIEKNTAVFYFPITWVVASPLYEFITSFYNSLMKKKVIEIPLTHGIEVIKVGSIYLEPFLKQKRPLIVETLSPIVVYRSLNKENKNFTQYYSPKDKDFNELIISNLLIKYRALQGKEIERDDKTYIKPVCVMNKETVAYFKGTWIKGWSGVFELSLPEELYPIAFSCGLGAKNSQGFGCIGIWRGGP